MKELFNLDGKVAIVTGGNRGIGEGIARGLARAGSIIVIAARNEVKTSEVVRDIKDEFSLQVIGVGVDIRETKSIRDMVGQVVDEFGRIDILVNNAGTNIRKMPQEFTEAEWDEIIHTNLRGAFFCSQAVYPIMRKVGGGKIINIGSLTSIVGSPKTAPYASSKGGVLQLTRSLAVAWAPDNIQVNAILPGHVDTPLTLKARKDFPGLNEHVLSQTPAGRWGTPDDFAGPAIFLASHASEFVTGGFLVVDGGYSQALLTIPTKG